MPKESQRNYYRSRSHHHGGSCHHRHGKHTSTRSNATVSKHQYSVVIQNCEEMLSNIRHQIDQLHAEHHYRDLDDSSRVAASSSSSFRSFNTISGLVSVNNGQCSANSDRQGGETSNVLPRLPSLCNLGKAMHSPR